MDELPVDTSSERENAGLEQRLARLGATQRALLEQRLGVGPVNGQNFVAKTLANLDKLMETFGGYGEHVDHLGGIGPALERSLAGARAACINVVIDSDAPIPGD